MQELDPTRKFEAVADFWQFGATKGGQAYDLLTPEGYSACCSPDGFKHAQCQCTERAPCT